MALGSLNLRVSKQDFLERINVLEIRMSCLQDVITRYGEAKSNLDQFIESGDDNYQNMIARIDENVMAAKKAWTALQETKASLEKTVDQMEGMSAKIGETIQNATEAAKSTVEAAIKVNSVL